MEPQTRNGKNTSTKNSEKLSWLWAIFLVAYLVMVVGLSFVAFYDLPENSDSFASPEEFDGIQARHDLFQLVSLGTRPQGSYANEISAINFLSSKIDTIVSQSKGLFTIEKDIQVASGHYNRYDRLNIYESIQNVVVKLTPINSNHSNAVLINSHFDSVLGSPGAGDDGSMVAVMLGVLNTLTKSKEAVKHPIIFLFNGNEEKGLEASHAFITKHKWARDVRVFINLEGMGVGGKEILFRSGPGKTWLLDYYGKAAKHPFATVIAEELFEHNLLPGDTDYAVFGEYGKLIGLDFVYMKNGYAYHTKLDRYSSVDDGTLQNTGDNLLALTRVLANADELSGAKEVKTTGKAVFFDVLGLFFISYSEEAGIMLNYSVCVATLVFIGLSIWLIHCATLSPPCDVLLLFLLSFGIYVGSLFTAAGLVCLLAYIIDLVGFSMSWFSQPWLIFGLYFCPVLFIIGAFPAMMLASQKFTQLPLNFGVSLFMHSHCIVLIILTVALTILHVRSTFLLTNVIIFYLLALIINLATGFYRKPHLWILPIIICQSIPLIFNSYIMDIVFAVYIPVSGRQPNNPELMIAFCAIGFSLLMFGFIVPMFSVFQGTLKIIVASLLLFVVCFIMTFSRAVSFPYTEETPQRHTVLHMARKMYGSSEIAYHEDFVFLMYMADRHSLETLEDVAAVNGKELYSGQQDFPQLRFYSDYYRWVRAPALELPDSAKLTLLSKEELSSNSTYRYTFSLSGPKTFRIYISPIDDATLVSWSFGSNWIEDLKDTKDIYEVSLQFGKNSPPYTFSLTLKVPDASQAAVSIGLQSRYLNEDSKQSYEMEKFIRTFPKWTNVPGTLATYDSYQF